MSETFDFQSIFNKLDNATSDLKEVFMLIFYRKASIFQDSERPLLRKILR